jgi:DNA-binding FadR family transcriptional regulator
LEVLEHAFDRYVPLLLAGPSLDGSGELVAQHRALAAALAARDPRAARSAVRQHVEGTARELRPLLAVLA